VYHLSALGWWGIDFGQMIICHEKIIHFSWIVRSGL
jgi:hypothetical protein